MKVNHITYERVFRIGQFASERIGIQIQLDENEKAKDGFAAAKKFVYSMAEGEHPQPIHTATVAGKEVKTGDKIQLSKNLSGTIEKITPNPPVKFDQDGLPENWGSEDKK